MGDKNNCDELVGTVINLRVNSVSLFEHISLLEDVIYDQACRLCGVFCKKTKESLWPQQADPLVNQTVYEEKLFNETDRAIIR